MQRARIYPLGLTLNTLVNRSTGSGYGTVPYAHLVGRIPAIDDHHLGVLAVAVLLALAEIGLVVDAVDAVWTTPYC